MHRFNKVYWGIILGLVTPLIVIIAIYIGVGAELELMNPDRLRFNLKFLSPFMRLSLIANMLYFIPYTKVRKNQLLKGLLIATFLYGIVIVIIHFL
jgi:hypothetical protein